MANVELSLAEAGAQKTGIVTLEEGIAASKLAAAVQASLALADTSQQYEVLHCVLDGDGAVVADDAIGTAYTHAGGTIVKAIAVSREAVATFDIDVLFATIAAFPTATLLSASAPIAVAAGQVGEGILTTWTLIVPPASILVAQQVNGSLVAAKLIDVYVVLSHA